MNLRLRAAKYSKLNKRKGKKKIHSIVNLIQYETLTLRDTCDRTRHRIISTVKITVRLHARCKLNRPTQSPCALFRNLIRRRNCSTFPKHVRDQNKARWVARIQNLLALLIFNVSLSLIHRTRTRACMHTYIHTYSRYNGKRSEKTTISVKM